MERIDTTNLTQIRQLGFKVLNKELGPVAMIRFLQQFEQGYGNYTEERHQWLDDLSIDEITNEIGNMRIR
ncbi:hypothetical protein WDW89_04360 [Deltaproteobacteria bacterium TL4]